MGNIFSFGGPTNNSPLVHFSPKPAHLSVRQHDSDESESISLRDLVESKCQSLYTKFNPAWWLPNGHFQTLYCVLGDFSKHDRVLYKRQYLRLLDGGTLGLDFVIGDSSKIKDDAPMIVVKHGLTGGSYEAYVRAILSPACTPVEEGGLGYRAVVVNFRGCAGTPITSPQLYSAGHTDDLRQALMFISHLYPNAPLLGLGFSLGANVMTRYLAEEGDQSRLRAGCVLACPWNLEKNNDGLMNSFLGKHIYAKGMGGNLMKLVKRHEDPLGSDPDHHVSKAVPLTLALRNPTLSTFDETFTRIAGGSSPPFPFATARDYYQWASSHHVVKSIGVPFLAINAADDPVVQHVPIDGGGNGFIVMVLTGAGGHLGWFQSGVDHVDRWTTKPVLEWMAVFGNELAHAPRSKTQRLYMDEDGYLKEEERPGLGCKEVERDGELIGDRREDEEMLQGL